MSKKSSLLIKEPPLSVLPSLAVKIGLDEAIVLQQLHYWLTNSKNEGRVDENGEKWVYNTYAQWQEDNFPFWSEDKIQRIFLSLEKKGLIISRQLDAKRRDMTKFYRLAWDEICALDDSFLRPSNTANLHDVKMNQRLPETTTEQDANASKPDLVDLELSKLPAMSIRKAIQQHFRINVNWDTKTSRQWLEWAHGENVTAEQIERAAKIWRESKDFSWQHPTLKNIFEKWQLLMEADNSAQTTIQSRTIGT